MRIRISKNKYGTPETNRIPIVQNSILVAGEQQIKMVMKLEVLNPRTPCTPVTELINTATVIATKKQTVMRT